ncbi:MAG: hypothetical protein M1822_002892 [Bathelium mastoideum]|nr:MAG: hypothetical protein M1822_002892 [Bathelium mastoideum]
MAATRTSASFGDEKPLQRSSSKVDAIRRGTLRISGPLPLLSDLEDELPPADRSAVSSRVHEAVTEKRTQLLRDSAAEQPLMSDTASQNEQAQDSAERRRHERSSAVLRDTRFSNGNASTFGPPFSINTDRSSVRESPKSDAKTGSGRKAKGGSLRAADPGGLMRPASKPEPSSTPQRSFSMPMREITPTLALQSHAPAVQFPRSKDLKPLNLRPTIQHRTRHRRATLGGSRPNTNNSGTIPKSFDDPFWDSIVPPEERDIGLAVTSGSNPKRRSRSADALRAINKTQTGTSSRRRSDEIRYWRASVEERPMSSESRYSGIPMGASGPERKVNSMHYRDASDDHTQPLSPRHGRIFDFGPVNEDEMEKIDRRSMGDVSGQEDVIETPTSNEPPYPGTSLPPKGVGADAVKPTDQQALEENTNRSAKSQSPPSRKPPQEGSQGFGSPSASAVVSATHHLPPPIALSHDQSQNPDQTSATNAPTQAVRPETTERKSGYSLESSVVPKTDHMAPYHADSHRGYEKSHEDNAQSYSDDYISLIQGQVQPELPSPLSPNTSTTFEAVSNVLAHERAARKQLETVVYNVRREVTELRSIVENRLKFPAYGGRGANDEMETYRSRSSETMDATKTLERLEGYGRHDDHRVTVVRSRFSGFDSVDDSNGGTNEEDDTADDNYEHIQRASVGQDDLEQAGRGQEQARRSPSPHSTDVESPTTEAFETPTEEASGYAYGYDIDDVDDDNVVDDVARGPLAPPGMRVPVAVGGMF